MVSTALCTLQAVKIFDREVMHKRRGFASPGKSPEQPVQPSMTENVRREIAVMKQITHPNVIKVRDQSHLPQVMYFASYLLHKTATAVLLKHYKIFACCC